MATYLATRFKDYGVRSKIVCVDPGLVSTDLLIDSYKHLGIPIEDGAQTSLYCSLMPWEQLTNGGFYVENALRDTPKEASDLATAQKVLNKAIRDINKAIPCLMPLTKVTNLVKPVKKVKSSATAKAAKEEKAEDKTESEENTESE